ncbi:MAG: GNAT family N-acetyltransferase [Anaerolineae bacterium]|nr:GNAT family N-acetyltransferase [Anaerolineae bacterium]
MEGTISPILTNLSQVRLASAVGENVAAAVPVFGIEDCLRYAAHPGVRVALTMIPGGPYISVAGARFEPGKADASIDAILADYHADPIDWWVGPESQPADLGDRLQAHGFKLRETVPGMAANLHDLVEPSCPVGLNVFLARGEKGWQHWTEACLRAWCYDRELNVETEPWYQMCQQASGDTLYLYSGWLDGEPAAVSMMVLGAGVAGLHFIQTRPEYRRRGIGSRLTYEPLIQARQLGYHVGVLTASEQGYPIYRNLGFQAVCSMRVYSWEP